MNDPRTHAITLPHSATESILATNKVIRNTYMLLSATLLFAAVTAAAAVAQRLPHPGLIITLSVTSACSSPLTNSRTAAGAWSPSSR